MTFPLKIVGLLKSKVADTVLKVTFNPTASYTVSITLTFTSGTLTMDWKDGSSTENFVSGVALTHTYTLAGTYVAEITGDYDQITQFNCIGKRLTSIQNLQTGVLSGFRIESNLYSGTLDMSDTQIAASFFYFYSNSGLTGFVKPAITGSVSLFRGDNCNITGELDIDTISLTQTFQINGNSNMTSIKHASNSNTMLQYRAQDCDITGTHDMKNLRLRAGGRFWIYNNTSLEDILFASTNQAHAEVRAYNCDLGYVDCTTLSLARANQLTYFYDNNMTAAEVNHMLVDFYNLVSGESAGGDYTGRIINIGGTNAAPDGTSGGYDGLTAKTNLQGKGFTVTTS